MIKEKPINYRDIKNQVYIVTGGTASLGADVVAELAVKGARIGIIGWATSKNLINLARHTFQNNHIYELKCDLSCANCVSTFAQEWLKPEKPRRLDGIICCSTFAEYDRKYTNKTCEEEIVNKNHLHQMHLLRELRPAFLLQPSDRDVRIVIVSHFNYKGDPWKNYPPPKEPQSSNIFNRGISVMLPNSRRSWKLYFQSNYLFGLYGPLLKHELSKSLRNCASNIHVLVVDSNLNSRRKVKRQFGEYKHMFSDYNECFRVTPTAENRTSCTNGVLYALFCPVAAIRRISPSAFYVNESNISERTVNKYTQRLNVPEWRLHDLISLEGWGHIYPCPKCTPSLEPEIFVPDVFD